MVVNFLRSNAPEADRKLHGDPSGKNQIAQEDLRVKNRQILKQQVDESFSRKGERHDVADEVEISWDAFKWP